MTEIGCYIIFSKKLNRFYTGAVQESLEGRLKKHNNHSYGNNRYTAIADDWEIVLFIPCDHYKQALAVERHIKKMKSTTYIHNLIAYPDLVVNIKERCK